MKMPMFSFKIDSGFQKRMAAAAAMALLAAALAPAASAAGPILKNINPQGMVTSSSVKITLDTDDLARCRYSTGDTDYESMGNDL